MANPGSPGRITVKLECVCACVKITSVHKMYIEQCIFPYLGTGNFKHIFVIIIESLIRTYVQCALCSLDCAVSVCNLQCIFYLFRPS